MGKKGRGVTSQRDSEYNDRKKKKGNLSQLQKRSLHDETSFPTTSPPGSNQPKSDTQTKFLGLFNVPSGVRSDEDVSRGNLCQV